MKKLLLLILLLIILAIEPSLNNQSIALNLEKKSKISATEFVLRFLGEIRYSLASYLWLSVELYHHEIPGLTLVTGKVGIENPKSAGEMIGLCKLVTQLDPHFVQAYDIASWRLTKGLGRFKQGIDFLNEGIENNPDSVLLYEDGGQFSFFYIKDYPESIKYLQKAIPLQHDDFKKELDLKLLAHAYEKTGERDKEIGIYEELVKMSPDDASAKAKLLKLRKM